MKLSTRARYALRMMVEIARHTNGSKKVSLNQVAKGTHISRRYLEQLAIALKNSDLITGVTGKGGGYMLAKPADKIKVGEIVEASIGPINIVDCVMQPEMCMLTDFCVCRPIYQRINDRITDILDEFSLADLASMKPKKNTSRSKNTTNSSCPSR